MFYRLDKNSLLFETFNEHVVKTIYKHIFTSIQLQTESKLFRNETNTQARNTLLGTNPFLYHHIIIKFIHLKFRTVFL